MVSVPNVPTRIADSLTLPIGVWLGIPALPVVVSFDKNLLWWFDCVM
ncbi:unnamed protein product [Timema podura]|uniref:Uncharacterized protein n=1 Tax=Timema podura TaxID=61482 RepID=A0ABN7PAE6_TIMPD|nr:unnamed protein product [Timema podura]